MDVSSVCGKTVLRNVGCSQGSSLRGDSIGELVSAFGRSLNIVGEECLNGKGVGKDGENGDVGGVDKGSVCAASLDGCVGKCNVNFYNKCATFPCSKLVMPRADSSDKEEEEEPETALRRLFGEDHYNQAYGRSVSLPSPLKLRSAMKGGREKEGLSTEKLTVKWALDVYDPPVTLVSHTVKSNRQKKSRHKKNLKKDGKKGQKSNSSRGKDKKQYRKGGTSERSLRYVDPCEMITNTNDDFLVVGSQETRSYCGSPFLKNSLTSMHYPVAEAL